MKAFYFDERIALVLRDAREEAARLNHEYVGAEHLLLGVLRNDAGLADQILSRRSVDKQVLLQSIENIIKPGSAQAGGTDLPYTSRAKRILELAAETSRDLRDDYFGTEHLLIALLKEQSGIASQVLTDAGLTVEASLKELASIWKDAERER